MAEAKDSKMFTDFPPVSTEDWEAKINTDLKGADYEKKLIWKTLEGFNVRPYYRAEDIENLDYLNVHPNEYPFVRGYESNGNNWEITQEIIIDDIKEANKNGLHALERGTTSLNFYLNDKATDSLEELKVLLNDIHVECIRANFYPEKNVLDFVKIFKTLARERNIDFNRLLGSIVFDPIARLTVSGNYYETEEQDFKKLTELTQDAELKAHKSVTINARIFLNAGSSIVQELALSLAVGVEYLSRLIKAGVNIDTVAGKTQFHFGIGSNYFMEIAKLRAARLLWANIVNAYQPESQDAEKMFIHSETSDWNKTVYDPHVNLLRGTTEAMSAILGGTDSLLVKPFDNYFRKPEKWTERIARNTQIILKEEAYLDKVVDPGAGSYYIENLTDNIAEEAWKLFLEVQDQGGYIEALKKGFIQQQIAETTSKRNQFVASRREVLLGTNQYPNADEKILDKVDMDRAFPEQTVASEKIAEPLLIYRGATEFEKLRLATEKSSKEPVVFLLTIGHPAWRKARAGFASGFFACAGYKIIDNLGFQSIEEGVEAATIAKADIVVVCSSDDEYPEVAPKAHDLLKDKAIVVVAGAPSSMEELKTRGIEHFIHVKSNVLETLKQFHNQLNITA
jgi:methylmalonyl-CoA mutase